MKQLLLSDFYKPTLEMQMKSQQREKAMLIGDLTGAEIIREEMAAMLGIYYTFEKKAVNGKVVSIPKTEFSTKEFTDYLHDTFKAITVGDNVAIRNNTEHRYVFLSSGLYLSLFKQIMDEIDPDVWNLKVEKDFEVRFFRDIKTRIDCFELPPYVVFTNGVYDLVNDEFHEGDFPEIINFYCTGYAYDETADCPKFKAAIWEALEDDDVIAVVQEAVFGLSFWYHSNERQSISLMWGRGRNFKGIIASIIFRLHGDGAVSGVSLDLLNTRFGPGMLYGKCANVASENQSGLAVSTSLLKAISGQDTLTVDQKYEKPFTARINCKLIISTNDIMFATDRSIGLAQRLVTIPFPYSFVPEPKLKNEKMIIFDLEQQLMDELPGICQWSFEGLRRLKAQNWQFTKCAKVEQLKHQILRDSDPVEQFFDTCVVAEAGCKVKKSEVYASFRTWAYQSGISVNHVVSANKFYTAFEPMLEDMGISGRTKKIQGIYYYSDIKLDYSSRG